MHWVSVRWRSSQVVGNSLGVSAGVKSMLKSQRPPQVQLPSESQRDQVHQPEPP